MNYYKNLMILRRENKIALDRAKDASAKVKIFEIIKIFFFMNSFLKFFSFR